MIKLAFQLEREAMRRAPMAEVLLLAGGAWRSLAVVPLLEEGFRIPATTHNPRISSLGMKDVAADPRSTCRVATRPSPINYRFKTRESAGY